MVKVWAALNNIIIIVDSTAGILIGDFQAIAPTNNEVKENFINITYHFFFEADNKVFNIFAGCSTYWKKKKRKIPDYKLFNLLQFISFKKFLRSHSFQQQDK